MDVEIDLGAKGDKNPSAAALAKQEDLSIYEWLSDLSSDGDFKVEIYRKAPKAFRGKACSGHIVTLEEKVDVEDIARQWGGGVYQIKAKRRKSDDTGFAYAGSRTVEIAGDPIVGGGDVQTGPAVLASAEPEGLAKRAMDMTEKAVEQERKRAERIESEYRERMYENQNRPAVDPGLLEALMGPARDTNRALADQVNRLQDQLASQMNTPRDGATNRLLEKFIEGDSSRIAQLQAMHDTELRTLKESSREDTRRAEDRLQKLMDTQERAHEREVQTIKSSYDQQLKMQEIAFTTQVKNLENMFAMAREELASSKIKIVELEAKKEKSMLDSMKEAVEMRELLEAFGGEKEEEPVWKQAIGAISESPLGQAVAAKLTGGAPGGQAGGAMPSGAPPLTPQQQAIVRARAIRAAQQQAHRIQPPSGGPAIQLNPAEVQLAVQYLENSLINGTTPEVFVQSARSSIPSGIIQAIRIMGIDQFIQQFVRMDENSHLATVRGRSFLRKVAQILVGEEGDGSQGDEVAVVAVPAETAAEPPVE